MIQQSLAAVLAELDRSFVVGFAQSRDQAVFVRRNGADLATRSGRLDQAWLFDLRLFTADAEFHWWWDQSVASGRHAILDDATARQRKWTRLHPTGRRLVRGTVHDSTAERGGWCRVHDGHSRPLWVPHVAKQSQRLAVGVVEYTSADDHGNVGVVAERFTGIEELR